MMINSYASHPCLMPVTRQNAEVFWSTCRSSSPIEPAIAESSSYTPPVLAGLFMIGIASYHLVIFIARQRRINRIAIRLQQIIALERMLTVKFQNRQ